MDTVTRGWVGTIVVKYPAGLVTHRDVECIGDWHWSKGVHELRDEDVLVFAVKVRRGQLKDAQGGFAS